MHGPIIFFPYRLLQTSGYGGAVFKSFKTPHEAASFIQANSSSSSKPSSSTSSASASVTSGTDQARKRPRENDAVSIQQKKTSNQQKQSSTTSTSNSRLHMTIHFDGGSRGNPGLAGAGAELVVLANSTNNATTYTTTTYLVREFCGLKQTNNYAEYKGLLAGLKQAKSCIEQYYTSRKQLLETTNSKPLFQLQIYGDSNLIIQQLRGAWQCRHPNIQPLFLQSQQLIGEMKQFDAGSVVLFDHVYRDQNKAADGEC